LSDGANFWHQRIPHSPALIVSTVQGLFLQAVQVTIYSIHHTLKGYHQLLIHCQQMFDWLELNSKFFKAYFSFSQTIQELFKFLKFNAVLKPVLNSKLA